MAKITISDDFTDRRITAGAKIFRALLAADIDIDKKIDGNGKLKLCLLYIDNNENAEKAKETLLTRNDIRIKKMDITIETLSLTDFRKCQAKSIAGVFITQSMSEHDLEQLIETSNINHFVIFSPFEGDVEKGVQSGIALEARVRPYLNMKSLNAAGIRLKAFFYKVARQYEN